MSIPSTHQIAPSFREEIDKVRGAYFARDPACWPVFGDPVFTRGRWTPRGY